MKLTYRGIQYDREKQNFLTSTDVVKNEIIYRGNSLEANIDHRFPLIKYIKQLLNKSRSQTVFDPVAFSYEHKREFLEACWYLENKELNRCWDLTLQIEKTKALKAQQKTKLKYRGLTYYR
ncbi:MAG: DUF4278 domain-containing protein [Pleurocapsa minor HA4230-MV1]|nr:DUF4278 domain-containing protein [Pleurocapsa minor HA4230-MV1]